MRQGRGGFVLAELHLLRIAEVIESPGAGRANDGSVGLRVTRRRTIGAESRGSSSTGGCGLRSRLAAAAADNLLVSTRPVTSSVCGMFGTTTLRRRPASVLPPAPPPGAPPRPPIGIPIGAIPV